MEKVGKGSRRHQPPALTGKVFIVIVINLMTLTFHARVPSAEAFIGPISATENNPNLMIGRVYPLLISSYLLVDIADR